MTGQEPAKITPPDLNFRDYREDYADALRVARGHAEHLRRPGALGKGKAREERRLRWLANAEADLAGREAMQPETNRLRTKPAEDNRVVSRTRKEREGAHVVAQRVGSVEFVHPGWRYDFRVAFRWSADGERLEVEGLAVIAKDGGPAVTATELRRANIGQAILECARALSARRGLDDNSDDRPRGTDSDIRSILADERTPPNRRSSRQVQRERQEARRLAEEHLAERSRYGLNKAVAEGLRKAFPGYEFSAQTAADRLRK